MLLANCFTEYGDHHREKGRYISSTAIVSPCAFGLAATIPQSDKVTCRQSRYSNIKDIPQRSISSNTATKAPPSKPEDTRPSGGADLPAIKTSTVDINAIPTHKGTGKPITQVNIDEDLPENDKPWRKPGTDLSDYFNYGFDEFTWALYASKQEQLRGEYNSDAITSNSKKMFEDMQNMMMMAGGAMPGMPPMQGMPGAGAGGAAGASMPGMDGMTPEIQAMMQQMMAGGGMDASQMDPAAMSAMFAGMQNAGGAVGQGQGQNFGGVGFGSNQGQGFGYDQSNRGGFAGGRGRRGRGGY